MAFSVILASASPQRRQLLQGLGIPFTVEPSSIEESACDENDPLHRAAHLARMKAQDVAARHPNAWVMGCDTLVVAPDGSLLEKPADAADAERMLRRQSGGVSTVHSGLCVTGPGGMFEGMSSSRVRFARLSERDIAWWMDSGHWRNRSGAFQIDGSGQLLIEHLEGDWTGVVGLPVYLFGQLLRRAGLSW